MNKMYVIKDDLEKRYLKFFELGSIPILGEDQSEAYKFHEAMIAFKFVDFLNEIATRTDEPRFQVYSISEARLIPPKEEPR